MFQHQHNKDSIIGYLVVLLVFSVMLIAPSAADAAFSLKKPFGDQEIKLKIYGFSQLEARAGEGMAKRSDLSDDGLRFQAQRIRLGTNYYYGNMFGKLFLDFNQSHSTKRAGLPLMIKDAFVGYRWCDSAFIRLGMIKTPLGLDFTIPGWNLDIIERNKLEKGMVFERDMGVLLSGRFIGFGNPKGATEGTEMGHEKTGKGFGYDLGVFNPAGRSDSVKDQDKIASDGGIKTTGDALAYVGRLHFDWGELFHCEAAYGISEEAGGKNTEDYEAFDAGISSYIGPLDLKLEYIFGQNISGVKDADQSTFVGTVGYMLNSHYELVAKHYQSNADPASGDESDLGNTYIGVCYYLTDLNLASDEITRKIRRKLQNHRIQLNYVATSGDDGDDWTGKWGYTDDAYLLQWQYKF